MIGLKLVRLLSVLYIAGKNVLKFNFMYCRLTVNVLPEIHLLLLLQLYFRFTVLQVFCTAGLLYCRFTVLQVYCTAGLL